MYYWKEFCYTNGPGAYTESCYFSTAFIKYLQRSWKTYFSYLTLLLLLDNYLYFRLFLQISNTVLFIKLWETHAKQVVIVFWKLLYCDYQENGGNVLLYITLLDEHLSSHHVTSVYQLIMKKAFLQWIKTN